MSEPTWFDDVPVIGRMPAGDAATKLREVGESKMAAVLDASPFQETSEPRVMGMGDEKSPWDKVRQVLTPRAWQHTAHTYGYLAPAPPGSEQLPIQHAGNIAPDASLRNARINIRLNQLRVADYPGRGMHRVLFDFYAQNHVQEGTEHLHFNATYRVREGQQAAVVGQPVFVGLNVGPEGVAFKCYTVNVKNDGDEAFLNVLEADEFKQGLSLASTVQPVIAPFTKMALEMTKAIATRNRNVPVQEFYMGLDFSDTPMGARLAAGS